MQKNKEMQKMQKIKKSDYLKLFFIIFAIVVFFVFLIKHMRESTVKENKFVESNYTLTKAKIIDKSTYKIWTLTVEYEVNKVKYKESKVVINNNLKVGDSIWIKYSNAKPNLIIIDLE